MLVVRLALRNASRNVRRTALTALTVLLGTMLLVVGMSWVRGIFGQFQAEAARSTGHVRVTTQAWAEREQLQPLYENIPRTAPLVQRLERVEGVSAVHPRLQLGVLASKDGGELGDTLALVVGAPLAYHRDVLGLPERVAQGAWFDEDPQVAGKQALVGRALAREMALSPGDKAIFLGRTQDGSMSDVAFTVVGIVDTGNVLYDKQVYVDLERTRWMADIPEGALEVLVYGEDYQAAEELQAQVALALADPGLAAELALAPDARLIAQAWSQREPWASALKLVNAIVGIVIGCIVFITALGVLNTMLMSVLERTGEIGVLRAMGLGTAGVLALFVVEALVISTVGGAVGASLGSGLAIALQGVGVDLGGAASNLPDTMPVNRVLHPLWSPDLAVSAFLLGLVMAVVGSSTPALRATRIQPVQAMRARR
ncbi:ABC transporter permease [Myxococcota bacterium]|nr:ABC transporter permease [Myxococcota bacterium]